MSDAPPVVRVAVFAPSFSPTARGSGPTRSIQTLLAAVPSACFPMVLTSDRDHGSHEPFPLDTNVWTRRDSVDVYYMTVHSPHRYWRAMTALRNRRPDLLYFNSFLNPPMTILPLMLWRIGFWGRPALLLAPRGEFGRGAMTRRRLKKRLYILFFRLLGTDRAVIWHSTAPHETADIRRVWGQRTRVIERREDTLLPAEALPPSDHVGPLRAVSLGRIVQHKGLSIALKALADVDLPVIFDVYGIVEDPAYFTHCERLAERLPENVDVSFRGVVAADQVVQVLRAYDVLLLPTAGESFGHVIAEALSASCSVVTTPHTPWSEELKGGGGIVADNRLPETWAAIIMSLAAEDPSARHARREAAGRAYDSWHSRPRGPHIWTLAAQFSAG